MQTATTTAYSNATSQFLAGLVREAYLQYDQGLADPTYNGDVAVPAGYTQVAAFKATELDLGSAARAILAANPQLVAALPAAPSPPSLAHAVQANGTSDGSAAAQQLLAAQPLVQQALDDAVNKATLGSTLGTTQVFFGFALKANAGTNLPNLIVLRGTQTGFEWAADASALQVPLPLVWFGGDHRVQYARAHLGFLLMEALLFDQIKAAAAQFDTSLPLQVTGHSLGASLSTLTGLAGALLGWGSSTTVYNQASPRVGDPIFVDVYNLLVPNTFRVVNLSDVVPVLPPTSLSLTLAGKTFDLQYAHVGQEWSYLWQTGNVTGNHSLADDYLPALQAQVETDAPRTFPSSGL